MIDILLLGMKKSFSLDISLLEMKKSFSLLITVEGREFDLHIYGCWIFCWSTLSIIVVVNLLFLTCVNKVVLYRKKLWTKLYYIKKKLCCKIIILYKMKKKKSVNDHYIRINCFYFLKELRAYNCIAIKINWSTCIIRW